MAKHKIRKNLTDADMLAGFEDQESYEEQMLKQDTQIPIQKCKVAPTKKSKEKTQEEFYREFVTEHLQTQIGKALLELRMEYFKDGEGDFSIQVRKQGRNILLETGPKKVKA